MLYDILNIDYQKGMERRMVFQRIRDMREDAETVEPAAPAEDSAPAEDAAE